MKVVELYGRVRYAVQIAGLSRREAARQFGIDPRTVAKMLAFSVPPGYRRKRPPARPKLDPFTGIIDGILAADEGRPRKQRHTSKRIFERLRDEHGYSGGITIVKDYVLARRLRQREVFVPLRHDPGHAQADFGEALAEIAGVERKIHFFAIDLPHSDACFVQAYPAETTAHTRAKAAVLDLQRPGLCETRTLRWSKRYSNRWSPTKRVPFTTILIDFRPVSSARRCDALGGPRVRIPLAPP